MPSPYKQARTHINAGVIIALFPDGIEKDSGNWRICSPFRNDKTPSLSIKLDTGQYRDLTDSETKGSLIDLIAHVKNVEPIEACKIIINTAGKEIIMSPKKEKPKAILPIPDTAKKLLTHRLKAKFSIDRFGAYTQIYPYKNKSGLLMFVTVRHEYKKPDGSPDKDIIPYYFTVDNKWKQGRPLEYSKKTPLYNRHLLSDLPDTAKIAISEGEKCVNVKLKDRTHVGWMGGCDGIGLADFSPLKRFSDIIYISDLDRQKDKNTNKTFPIEQQPGYKAAQKVKKKLPQLEILDVYKNLFDDKSYKNGYDIADTDDPDKFIKDNYPTYSAEIPKGLSNEIDYKNSFLFLGWDVEAHYFLRHGAEEPLKIPRCRIPADAMLELRDLSWWMQEFPSKRGYDKDVAKDWLIQTSLKSGRFDKSILRGAGCWKDGNDFLINDGHRLFIHGMNQPIKYRDYDSTDGNVYVMGHCEMDNYIGETATTEEGQELLNLFIELGFKTTFEAVTALGWALASCFGASLKWRSHFWLTGQKGSGKSHVMDIIKQLVGKFALTGSGKSTEAGTRRSLGDGRPVIYDEMEPKTKETMLKIEAMLELARNCSSDFSSESRMAKGTDGVEVFKGRSMFMFASVVPALGDDAATASRFIIGELALAKGDDFKKRVKNCSNYMSKGVMKNPIRYRRRIWNNFRDFIHTIEEIGDLILSHTGDKRKADNLAVPFAATYTAISDLPFSENTQWQKYIIEWIGEQKNDSESDEDKLIREILETQIKLDDTGYRSIGELIAITADRVDPDNHNDILQRHGIKWSNTIGLVFQCGHKEIKRMLRDTPYVARYEAVLERHEMAIDKRRVRFGKVTAVGVVFDWDGFEGVYFGE